MHTFIINLKKNIQRRDEMESQLNNTIFKYEFIEAVDGRKLSQLYLLSEVLDPSNCPLTLAEIGCSLSHKKIYQKMVDENIKHALILEDDCIFPKDMDPLYEVFGDIIAHDNPNIPNVYLSTLYSNFHNDIWILPNVAKTFQSYEAHAYLINLAAAKEMLSFHSPIRFTADYWRYASFRGYINTYSIVGVPLILQKSIIQAENSYIGWFNNNLYPYLCELIESNFTITASNKLADEIDQRKKDIFSNDLYFPKEKYIRLYNFNSENIIISANQVKDFTNIYNENNYGKYLPYIQNFYLPLLNKL